MSDTASTTTVMAPSEQAAIRRLMDALGIERARQRLGVGRSTLERAAGGLTVRRGSAALLRLSLQLEEGQP